MPQPKKLTTTQVFIGKHVVPLIKKTGTALGIDIEEKQRLKLAREQMEKEKARLASEKAAKKMVQREKDKEMFLKGLETIRKEKEARKSQSKKSSPRSSNSSLDSIASKSTLRSERKKSSV